MIDLDLKSAHEPSKWTKGNAAPTKYIQSINFRSLNLSLSERIKEAAELHGEFILRSGKTSDRYFDKYRFESDPVLLSDITSAMVELVPSGTEVLCGLEMGGIPIVTMLSQHTGIPAAFIRKEPKTYGTCNYAEGADLIGKRIVLVEDVVSSGGAITDAAQMMRADGIDVSLALCVIDRETGGAENLAAGGIQLVGLIKVSDMN